MTIQGCKISTSLNKKALLSKSSLLYSNYSKTPPLHIVRCERVPFQARFVTGLGPIHACFPVWNLNQIFILTNTDPISTGTPTLALTLTHLTRGNQACLSEFITSQLCKTLNEHPCTLPPFESFRNVAWFVHFNFRHHQPVEPKIEIMKMSCITKYCVSAKRCNTMCNLHLTVDFRSWKVVLFVISLTAHAGKQIKGPVLV